MADFAAVTASGVPIKMAVRLLAAGLLCETGRWHFHTEIQQVPPEFEFVE